MTYITLIVSFRHVHIGRFFNWNRGRLAVSTQPGFMLTYASHTPTEAVYLTDKHQNAIIPLI